MDLSGNLLLDVLPPAFRSELLNAAQHLDLPNKTQLEECHRPPSYAYFITSGMASVVTEMKEGGSMEVTLISCEGMTGKSVSAGFDGARYGHPYAGSGQWLQSPDGSRRRPFQ